MTNSSRAFLPLPTRIFNKSESTTSLFGETFNSATNEQDNKPDDAITAIPNYPGSPSTAKLPKGLRKNRPKPAQSASGTPSLNTDKELSKETPKDADGKPKRRFWRRFVQKVKAVFKKKDSFPNDTRPAMNIGAPTDFQHVLSGSLPTSPATTTHPALGVGGAHIASE